MKKSKQMKPLNSNVPTYKQPLQHDVEKAQQREKIEPKKIFEMMDGKKTSQKKTKKKY